MCCIRFGKLESDTRIAVKPLVFWQNIPSIHQAPLVRAMATLWNGPVTFVAESDIPQRRIEQGWERPDFGGAALMIAPSKAERSRLVASSGNAGGVHIFGGLRTHINTSITMRVVARTDAKIGVCVEPLESDDGIKAVARRLLYRALAWRWGKRINFMLVTGQRGVREYAELGFKRHTIFPFSYVVSESEQTAAADDRSADRPGLLRLCFVGQLIERKGLGLLLRGLERTRYRNWILDIVGSGPMKHRWQRAAVAAGLADRICWRGVVPNSEARALMASADVLILPSYYDGWGAVVNEALAAGTRVLVSDACGAADLAQACSVGRVFRTGSLASLTENLEGIALLGPVKPAERQKTESWARHAIGPTRVAEYLARIIEFVESEGTRPVPPWLAG